MDKEQLGSDPAYEAEKESNGEESKLEMAARPSSVEGPEKGAPSGESSDVGSTSENDEF